MEYPLSLGLYALRSQRMTKWGLTMAGATPTVLPLIVIFLVAQRHDIRGVVTTGIKG